MIVYRPRNKSTEWYITFKLYARTMQGIVLMERVEARRFPGTAMTQYRRLKHRR